MTDPAPPSLINLSYRDPTVAEPLNDLIRRAGGDPDHEDARFIREMLITALKLFQDGRDRGELKLMAASMKELRHAFRVFARHPHVRKISIFGSARTPEDHPDYAAAVEFSRQMALRDWAVITGAGDGIMKAGHVGPGRESSFGLAIRLPFETTANTVIAGDPKLITFKYFFTRKLMFVSQADAVALFPGGFGTQDEAFEVLTLVQTGKSSIVPIVLVEGESSRYWADWRRLVEDTLLAGGFICEEDLSLFYHAHSPADAADHVQRFYRNYQSSRYVGDQLVIRLRQRLRDEAVVRLNDEFAGIVREGRITQSGPLDGETDHLELPRLVFTHTRRQWGIVRRLIDRLNEMEPADPSPGTPGPRAA
ncbi:MAG: LOG family protein [Planctomycetota bacterium]|nr:MAG: LOG family protein [Planctomycetota bacterium]